VYIWQAVLLGAALLGDVQRPLASAVDSRFAATKQRGEVGTDLVEIASRRELLPRGRRA